MRGISGEHGVVAGAFGICRPDVQLERRQDVRELHFGAPGFDRGMLLRQVAGLPLDVRQRLREMDGMLAGPRPDLEDARATLQLLAQDFENRLPVALRSRCFRQRHRTLCSAAGSNSIWR